MDFENCILTGEPGKSYGLESSSDLLEWAPWAVINLPSGGRDGDFSDGSSSEFGYRFYRVSR